MSRSTIYSLQAGRGLAACSVVLFHANLASRDFAGLEVVPFRYGYLGVDFFFVLSGFIIYHSTVGVKPLPDYAWSRFRRIYLPYWPIGIGLALLYVLLPGVSASNRNWSWFTTLTLAPIDASPALSVAWTLQHEVLFYLLFGVFYYARILWFGLTAWALAIAAGLPNLPFQPVNLEFLFGIAAAVLYRRGHAHPAWTVCALAALAAWIGLGALEACRPLVGLALAFVIAPIAQLEREHFSVPRWLVLLGAASYSIYLAHAPLVSIAARFAGEGTLPVAVLLGIAGGLGYHALVERPLCGLKSIAHEPVGRQPPK